MRWVGPPDAQRFEVTCVSRSLQQASTFTPPSLHEIRTYFPPVHTYGIGSGCIWRQGSEAVPALTRYFHEASSFACSTPSRLLVSISALSSLSPPPHQGKSQSVAAVRWSPAASLREHHVPAVYGVQLSFQVCLCVCVPSMLCFTLSFYLDHAFSCGHRTLVHGVNCSWSTVIFRPTVFRCFIICFLPWGKTAGMRDVMMYEMKIRPKERTS